MDDYSKGDNFIVGAIVGSVLTHFFWLVLQAGGF